MLSSLLPSNRVHIEHAVAQILKLGRPRIGMLDPTLGYGQVWGVSDADWRALDLIGWEFIFRGWILFGYARRFGPEALWLQATRSNSSILRAMKYPENHGAEFSK